MDRRKFFKRLAVGAGTLAFAPTVIAEFKPIEQYGIPDYWELIEELIEQQALLSGIISAEDFFLYMKPERTPLETIIKNIPKSGIQYEWHFTDKHSL